MVNARISATLCIILICMVAMLMFLTLAQTAETLPVRDGDGGEPTQERVPYTPSGPSPSSAATNQPISLILSWSGGDPDGDTVTYTVYLDTSSNPITQKCSGTSTSCPISGLNYSTTYYWKVVADDGITSPVDGPVWSLATQLPPTPTPIPAVLTSSPTPTVTVTSIVTATPAVLTSSPTPTVTVTSIVTATPAVKTGTAVIRDGQLFDLDNGMETSDFDAADFWWGQIPSGERYLVPKHGGEGIFKAEFAIMGMADFKTVNCSSVNNSLYSSAKINGSIDSNQIPTGTVVCAKTNLGNYSKFRIDSYGYDLTISWELKVSPIEVAAFVQPSIFVYISSIPEGAQILMDGKNEGKLTPDKYYFQDNGNHAYELLLNGYLPYQESFYISESMSKEVNLQIPTTTSTPTASTPTTSTPTTSTLTTSTPTTSTPTTSTPTTSTPTTSTPTTSTPTTSTPTTSTPTTSTPTTSTPIPGFPALSLLIVIFFVYFFIFKGRP